MKNSERNRVSLIKLLPNIITLTALSIGMTSIKYGLNGNFEYAVICILAAGFLDALDGRVARILNATSTFGAELDSLSDFVNFGVSPSIILYLWAFQNLEFKLIYWGCVVFFSLCTAIRLARFNTDIIDNRAPNPYERYFFRGMPSPVAAILALIPMIIDFDIAKDFNINIEFYKPYFALYIIAIAFLMPSRIPTPSLKYVKISSEFIWLGLLCSGLLIILLISYPWYSVPALGILYFCSIPISVMYYLKLSNVKI